MKLPKLKPIWKWGWIYFSDLMYTKDRWVIMLPNEDRPDIWRLKRKSNGAGPPNLPGEMDLSSEREAFQRGNDAVKDDLPWFP